MASQSTQFNDSCIFCLIIQGNDNFLPLISVHRELIARSGKLPSFKIYETELSLAFLNINPVSEGHSLIIPKYHAQKILDLPDEYLADIGPILKKMAKAAGADQFNILQNNGEMAFQHVHHVHFHVVPKPSPTEGLVVTMEDNWPVKTVSKEELAQTAEKMMAKLE